MIRAIKRRIYPTEEQVQFFERNFGCARFVYNQLLERQIKNHEQGEKFANKYIMVHWLTELKTENPWLKEVDSRALQEAMFALESGYLSFFHENNAFPNFKSKKSARQSYTTNAKLKVARQHEKIRNQRQDFLHKLSNEITNQYDYVAIEDLSVANMVKNHKLAKAIEDCSWGEFARQLEYKSEWRGKTLKKIGRFEPSSKTCSSCGYVKHNLILADREWDCPECHAHHDRDVNAAKNILVFSNTAGTVGSGRGGANNG